MIQEIKWREKETLALGRNGYMRCLGVEIYEHSSSGNCLEISPINSKDNVGRCHIGIPLEDVEMFCWVLQEEARRIKRERGNK